MSSVAVKPLAGDREAFAELYRQFRSRVLGVCCSLLGSPDEAEDAANEVFARLPRATETYDSSLPFWHWLSRVARNYCVDLLRRRRSERRIFDPADSEVPDPAAPVKSPFEELLWAEERGAVRAAVARLPERHFVPLVMRYYSDLSYDEIAETLGISRASVKTLIFRAKEELRRLLARKGAVVELEFKLRNFSPLTSYWLS